MTRELTGHARASLDVRDAVPDSVQPLRALLRAVGDRSTLVSSLVHAPLATPTRDRYRQYLCDLYGFMLAFERELVRVRTLEVRFVQSRMRSSLIAADLLALGMTPVVQMRLARRYEVSSFGGPIDALGWLFVVELLSWQTRDVRQRLSTTLGPELDIAGSFFALHDGVHRQRWRELSRMLDRWVVDASALQALCAAAQSALDSLESWMVPVDLP